MCEWMLSKSCEKDPVCGCLWIVSFIYSDIFSQREPFVFVAQGILSSKEQNKTLMLILSSLKELIDF